MPEHVRIQTFKEGLLSRMAHDLQLRVERFEITVRGSDVRASFDPTSLRVDGALAHGRVDPTVLSTADRDKIQRNIEREVLHSRVHGPIEFSATVEAGGRDAWGVRGTLRLHGRSLPVSVTARAGEDGRLRCHAELVPSRWGIKPYRALGGTLRIQDRVVIEIDLDRSSYALPE